MTETVRIDETQSRSWASETTLARLLDAARDHTELLSKLAGVKNPAGAAARAAAEGLGKIRDSAEDVVDAFDQTGRAVKKSSEQQEREAERQKWIRRKTDDSYRDSLNNLRSTLDKVNRSTPGSLWENMGNNVAVAGGRLTELGGVSRLLGSSFTQLSRVMAVATMGFAYYRDGYQALTNMTESGVLFNGSVEQMRQSVGRTGLSLDSFGQLVGQYGTAISGVGEQAFNESLRQVQDLTRHVGRYGQSVEAQAASLGAFFDIMRSGGQIYMMDVAQRSRATAAYLAETTALTRLTGRQRKEIEAEQNRVMARAEVDLAIREMRARGDTEGADKLAEMVRVLTTTMGESAGTAAAGMAVGIAPRDQDLRTLLSTSGQYSQLQSLTSQFRTLTPEEITRQVTGIYQSIERPDFLAALRQGAQAGGGMEGAARAYTTMARERGDVLRGRVRTGEIDTIMDVMGGRRGILDQAATGFAQVTGDVQRAMGDLRAVVAALTEQFRVFSTVFPMLSSVTGAGTGITNMLYNLASSSLGGAAAIAGGAYLGSRVMGGAARLAAGTGGTGGVATPGIGARLAGGAASLGRMGGMGAGLAGVGAGSYYAATGESFTARMLGIGGSALSGAATGAAFGGPWGALIGGALGLGSGVLSNLMSSPAQPGAISPPLPLEEIGGGASQARGNMVRLDTAMAAVAAHLAPEGHIVARLAAIEAAVNAQGRNIVTAVGQI